MGVLEAVLFCRCIGGVPASGSQNQDLASSCRLRGSDFAPAFGDDVLANALQLRLFFFVNLYYGFYTMVNHHPNPPFGEGMFDFCPSTKRSNLSSGALSSFLEPLRSQKSLEVLVNSKLSLLSQILGFFTPFLGEDSHFDPG